MVSFIGGSMAFVSSIVLLVRQHFFRSAFRATLVDRRQKTRLGKRVRRLSRHRSSQSVSHAVAREGFTRPDDAVDVDAKSLESVDDDVYIPMQDVEDQTIPSVKSADREPESVLSIGSPQTSTVDGRVRIRNVVAVPSTQGQAAIDVQPSSEDAVRGSSGPPLRRVTSVNAKRSGYGGFPMPFGALRSAISRIAPRTSLRVQRTLSLAPVQSKEISRTETFASFRPNVGRNSVFLSMTSEQKEEMGGVEYRASRLLLLIVYCYIVIIPLLAFVIVGPLLTVHEPYDDFLDSQHRRVATPWFAAFNVWSAFTNCGMSLSDTSMIPFINAHLFVFVTTVLIFAGNTAYPILLRCIIWTLNKISHKESRLRATTNFLLQHPRRCFLYLFPAQQTWYLAAVLFTLTSIDFAAFLILDINNSVIEEIPVGTRLLAALMQSAAIRVEGYAIVPLAALVPAVQVLYVIMMYIAVLPLSLMVRSTNVYEDKTLGVYPDKVSDDSEPAGRSAIRYIGWHARRQLAFDMWWLALSLWLICIVERDRVTDYSNEPWFNIFSVIFEIVSAYGTVGLSLGSSDDNFSLSGNFRTLSKLVLMVVMLRGRHRALPLAIDRAVMLPSDCDEVESLGDEYARPQADLAPDDPSQGCAGPSSGALTQRQSQQFSQDRIIDADRA